MMNGMPEKLIYCCQEFYIPAHRHMKQTPDRQQLRLDEGHSTELPMKICSKMLQHLYLNCEGSEQKMDAYLTPSMCGQSDSM